MATIEKPRLKCCCNHPDSSACRNADDAPGYETDYQCECCCHQADMDGEDDWDRYFADLKAWKESLPEVQWLRDDAESRDWHDGTIVEISVNDVQESFRVKLVDQVR